MNNEQGLKEISKFFIQLFMSAKQFQSDLNSLIIEMFQFSNNPKLQLIMKRINGQAPQIFKVKRCYLWVIQQLTGIAYTFNYNQIQFRSTHNTGLFKILFENKKTIHVESKDPIVVCQLIQKHQQIKSCNCLLMPIKNQEGNVISFLQVTNKQSISIEIEYLCVIIMKYIKQLMKQQIYKKILKNQLKMLNDNYKYFEYLCNSSSKIDFLFKAKQIVLNLLDVKQMDIVFVMNDKFNKIIQNKSVEFGQINSLTFITYKQNYHRIYTNSLDHPSFDPEIDMYSIRPVHYYPISQEENKKNQNSNVIGIIQIVDKSKKKENDFIYKNSLMEKQEGLLCTNDMQKVINLLSLAMKCKKVQKFY